jgi:hypothetical protein
LVWLCAWDVFAWFDVYDFLAIPAFSSPALPRFRRFTFILPLSLFLRPRCVVHALFASFPLSSAYSHSHRGSTYFRCLLSVYVVSVFFIFVSSQYSTHRFSPGFFVRCFFDFLHFAGPYVDSPPRPSSPLSLSVSYVDCRLDCPAVSSIFFVLCASYRPFCMSISSSSSSSLSSPPAPSFTFASFVRSIVVHSAFFRPTPAPFARSVVRASFFRLFSTSISASALVAVCLHYPHLDFRYFLRLLRHIHPHVLRLLRQARLSAFRTSSPTFSPSLFPFAPSMLRFRSFSRRSLPPSVYIVFVVRFPPCHLIRRLFLRCTSSSPVPLSPSLYIGFVVAAADCLRRCQSRSPCFLTRDVKNWRGRLCRKVVYWWGGSRL